MEINKSFRAYDLTVSIMYEDGTMVRNIGLTQNPLHRIAVGTDLSDALSNFEFTRTDLRQIEYGEKFSIKAEDVTPLFPKNVILVRQQRKSS